MPDRFSDHSAGLTAPASHGFAITPSDTLDLAEVTRAIYVGGSGNVSVIMSSGAEIALIGLPAGTVLPIRARRIKLSGTNATNLVGLV